MSFKLKLNDYYQFRNITNFPRISPAKGPIDAKVHFRYINKSGVSTGPSKELQGTTEHNRAQGLLMYDATVDAVPRPRFLTTVIQYKRYTVLTGSCPV